MITIVKVSIIVPIYNREETIRDSVKSIINQTLSDIEIILVNDGSSDTSLHICEELSQMDSRIQVINKVNGGVSSARNIGIQAAKGDFIGFVDPDDFIETEMFEKLYINAITFNSDMVFCDYFVVRNNNRFQVKLNFKESVILGDDIKKILLDVIAPKDILDPSSKVSGFIWRILIKREIVVKEKILFDENVSVMEDELFLVRCLLKTSSLAYLQEALYNYVVHDDSTVNTYNSNLKTEQGKVFSLLKELTLNDSSDRIVYERFKNRYYFMVLNNIRNEINSNIKFNLKINLIKKSIMDSKMQEIIKNIPFKSLKSNDILLFFIKMEKPYLVYLYFKLIKMYVFFKHT